ncbi:MAG: zf-TFIIB domain-containing protein [Phycisphaerales bacterium]|nr:zf-TFIIB domain-containing protein [Phycisphaerales bacterium]
MNCPICNQILHPAEYEGVTIDICDGCGGEFLDADELGHIVRARDMKFTDEVRVALEERVPAFGVPMEQRRSGLNCPKCGEPMRTMNYSGDSGVYVDRCNGCGGFWLDAEELEQVQILQEHWEDEAPLVIRAMAGELEQARLRAAEQTSRVYAGSRFAFVNALINRLLDAA